MPTIGYFSPEEYQNVRSTTLVLKDKLSLIADMCRVNALAAVKRAGSGHLGSSFSSLDIVTMLYYSEMNVFDLGIDHPDRDIYFSSKGHDVPGLYSVLFSAGILPKELFLKLRRLDGTFGHPDVRTPGIEANSGSLGMGISKAKGLAFAKKLLGRGGRIFVMTGDGELQEGQNYEALQSAVHQNINNLHVIVDHNKLQSDKPVTEICNLMDLETKLRAFGWHVSRCDGHDFDKLTNVLAEFKTIADKPKILIADTIKGCGVSFMEHPRALKDGGGLYRWHSGAPDDESYVAAHKEIVARISDRAKGLGLSAPRLVEVPAEKKIPSSVSKEYVAKAFGEALVDVAAFREDIVVLDADLATDCRVREFENTYGERFIENGIAEQDMVSMAGGLALHGLLPVVNTFASFLASRANEQIYNNVCEQTKIIYVCHYSGLIPAGPGASHQSVRDISLLGALPNFIILQPCNAEETRMVVEHCVNNQTSSCAIRLVIGPSPREIHLPDSYAITPGKGIALTEGNDGILMAYGPVMLHEALLAAEILSKSGLGLKVVNMPWLNQIDDDWLDQMVDSCERVFVLEDHSPIGGLGDRVLESINKAGKLSLKQVRVFGVQGHPACGTPQETLRFHRLDGQSIANRIQDSQRSPVF